MEPSFRQLPAAKRRRILNAALQEFALHDYKAANTASIAARAGISKGMLFYYFKDKKTLYLTLVRWLCELMEREMQIARPTPQTDLFLMLDEIGRKKKPLLKSMPGVLEFSVRAFYHPGGELGEVMDRYMLRMTDMLFDKYLAGVDTAKFKPGYGPRQAVDLLIYLTDGYLHTQRMAGRPLDVDALYEQYEHWQEMVRAYVYRPECLPAQTIPGAAPEQSEEDL